MDDDFHNFISFIDAFTLFVHFLNIKFWLLRWLLMYITWKV